MAVAPPVPAPGAVRGLPALLALLLLGTGLPAGAATIHVPSDQPTVQAAIDVALPGDTVLVAPGVYTGPGNRDVDTEGKGIVIRSEAGAAVTVLDAGGSETDPHRCFEFHSGEPATTRIEGFTLRGGWVTSPYPDDMGGAVLCRGDAAPVFADCCFEGNSAYGVGGGLAAIGAAPTVLGCTFTHNEIRHPSGDGGGIYAWHGTVTIEDSAFYDNQAHEGAGVCVATSSNVVVRRCVFALNQATSTGHAGSGVIVVGAYALIESCTFSDNVTGPDGYTVALVSDAGFVERNIVSGATGNGLFCSSTTYCDCCDVWQSAGVNFDGGFPGTHNFSADPEFCDSPGLDFTIRQSSPCAAAHTPAACDLIGALGVGCGPVAIDATTWGAIKASFAGTML
jgi:hypothetical protein